MVPAQQFTYYHRNNGARSDLRFSVVAVYVSSGGAQKRESWQRRGVCRTSIHLGVVSSRDEFGSLPKVEVEQQDDDSTSIPNFSSDAIKIEQPRLMRTPEHSEGSLSLQRKTYLRTLLLWEEALQEDGGCRV